MFNRANALEREIKYVQRVFISPGSHNGATDTLGTKLLVDTM